MTIEPLGQLQRDPDIEEWLVSRDVSIPYLDGQSLQFIIECIEDDETPEDFEQAIRNFLSLTADDRHEATPYVFQNYRQFVEAVGEDEFDFTIPSASKVWEHVQMTAIHVSRRTYAEKDVYVQITGNCDWEQEHGLQVVLRRGNILARVSDQDGHLTTADAYALSEEQNTIIYEG
ncbi:MAG: hypothetical protein M8364_03145 [Methylobacter sp.]|uniref:DUF6985 domain-containing protein n=1 Tax=Methylobacter sp. TaxID=2051955 RepID=UPI00258AE746|nr:hypothetical protein [Methylobacter sp.]MCL7419884.1 hypothetical protein [Methylobacter sp.]